MHIWETGFSIRTKPNTEDINFILIGVDQDQQQEIVNQGTNALIDFLADQLAEYLGKGKIFSEIAGVAGGLLYDYVTMNDEIGSTTLTLHRWEDWQADGQEHSIKSTNGALEFFYEVRLAYPPAESEGGSNDKKDETGCTNSSSFVRDVTVPDGTVMQPGESFVKTWRLENTGTCTWTTDYMLNHVEGPSMGASTSVQLPHTVYPGNQVDVSVTFTAPWSEGEYKSRWQMFTKNYNSFGVRPYVLISVSQGESSGSQADDCTDNSKFIADITVPDGTTFSPGESFVKTWRLQNTGSCTWTSDYHFKHIEGPKMGAPDAVRVPYSVPPGEYLDISVRFVAPSSSGTYKSRWQLYNDDWQKFGQRPFVLIKVR